MDYYHDNWGSRYFSGWRNLPFPTIYEEHKTAVTVDVLHTGWIVAFATLAFSIYVIVPGQPKWLLVFIRVTSTLILGLVIMLCNFGQQWEVGNLTTLTPYRAGSATEINAHIGVKFGLRSVNITLKASNPPTLDLKGEKIDYNERFSWTWAQGRFGFGPTAGLIQREFREHQRRGTPIPILWIAEYFTFDGEGIRFGRHYRYAGWYAHMCIWAALPAWVLTVVLFKMVVSYGAMMLSLTGACLTTAALLWATIRNRNELSIPFDPPEKILTTHFGAHWYMALLVGVFCMLTGILIYIVDITNHELMCELLGINPTSYIDEEYEEIQPGGETPQFVGIPGASSDDIEMNTVGLQQPQTPRVIRPLSFRFRSRGTTKWKTQQLPVRPYQQGQAPPGVPRRPPPSAAPPAHLHPHRRPHEYQGQSPIFQAPAAPNIEVTQHPDTGVDYGDVAPPDFDLGGQLGPAAEGGYYDDVAHSRQQLEFIDEQPLYANIDHQGASAAPWQQHR